MKYSQKIIALIVLAVIGIGFIAYLATQQGNDSSSSGEQVETDSVKGVQITNTDDYKDLFDLKQIPAVETAIAVRLKQNSQLAQPTYTAEIRKDSFQTTYNDYQQAGGTQKVPTYSFMVDIPDAEQSYKVTFSGGSGYPYSILHVLCPSSSERIYNDFGCKDSEQ